MSTKFVVHNVFHLSESRKKSQFHPFSTTTNFRFKSLGTVFIIIHFIFLEPRHLLQSGSGRKKNPQTAKNAVKPLYTKETQLTCNAGEFGGRTKPDCLSQNNVLSAIFDFSMEIRNPHLTRPKAPIFLAFNVSVTQAETFAKKKPANQV